jgi:hypothetical protein
MYVTENESQQHGAGKVLLREIEDTDVSELCALLAEGFPRRKFDYWQTALDTLACRPALEGYPRYGYCLEVDGRLEGVLLLLTARIDGVIRSNLSSWYMRSRYRVFASLMHQCAVRVKGPVYLNLSPAAHTLRNVEAFGFKPYTDGTLIVDAISAVKGGDSIVRPFAPEAASKLDAETRCTAEVHLGYGCEALLLEDRDGPMLALYRVKWLKHVVPAARFVAGDPARLVMSSGRLMRVLLQHGIPLALIDAPLNYAPPRGIRLLANRERRYAAGTEAPPAAGDLRETEIALFGP